jgi:membrane associated rhomboid family serine protease
LLKPWPDQPRVLKIFASLCVGFELLAIIGNLFVASDGVRRLFLVLGGFWPELLSGAPEIYPGQTVTMFATSALLHGGPLHLFMNMVGLLWLGPMVIDRLGARAFWPIAGLTALGAGLVFAALSQNGVPMIGASGILFGLVGVLVTWEVRDRLRLRTPLRALFEQAAVFVALNLALMLLAGGSIAWQAHLGGFLAGVLCGLFTWPGNSPGGRVARPRARVG